MRRKLFLRTIKRYLAFIFLFLGTQIVTPVLAMSGAGFDTRGGIPPAPLPGSALSMALPYGSVNWDFASPSYSSDDLMKAFVAARDRRFLESYKQKSFPRRIPFLYPDDGCPARAAVMKDLLAKMGIRTVRLFVFGDLKVSTPNHPSGMVSWRMHTAPAAKTKNGDVVVFDPALNPSSPTPIEQWILLQTGSLESIRLSVCNEDTFGEQDSCLSATDSSARAYDEVQSLLILEWERQVQLGRDPLQVLGDKPIWN